MQCVSDVNNIAKIAFLNQFTTPCQDGTEEPVM